MNTEARRPVWIALSALYLDNELDDYDFKYIATEIARSAYDLHEVKRIDREEVFAVLHVNLLNVAGVYDGFQEDWLVQKITENARQQNWLRKRYHRFMYRRMHHMFSDYWQKIEAAYRHLPHEP